MIGKTSLKSAFLSTFENGLEPYGFKRLKGTVFFGKLVNDEILLHVSYDKCGSVMPGKKAFRIMAGASTIYSYDLSNSLLLHSNAPSILAYDNDSITVDMSYHYDNSSVIEAVETSLNDTIKAGIPVLSNINDLRSYVDFAAKFMTGFLYNADKFYQDSVALILSDNHDDFSEIRERSKKSLLNAFNGDSSNPYYQSSLQNVNSILDNELIAARDKVYADPKLMEGVKKEAASRKEKNLQTLRSYGLLD